MSEVQNVETQNVGVPNVEEGKTLFFNPGGYILKVIFSIGVPIWMMKGSGDSGVFSNIIGFLFMALLLYGVATLFGFALRATGNYLVAAIVFGIFVAIFFAGINKLDAFASRFGNVGTAVLEILFMVLLTYPVIKDFKKAKLYFTHTV